MIRIIISVWIYLSSLIGIAASAAIVSTTLKAFPNDYYRTFGPHAPAVSKLYAEQLHYAATAMEAFAFLSIIFVIYYLRSKKPADIKCFYVGVISALNYFAALLPALMLILAYFMLPKLANGA